MKSQLSVEPKLPVSNSKGEPQAHTAQAQIASQPLADLDYALQARAVTDCTERHSPRRSWRAI